VQAGRSKKMQDPNQKVTKDKRAGSVAQVVDCLSSIPRLKKEKKKRIQATPG
jgi:hypothetical protein